MTTLLTTLQLTIDDIERLLICCRCGYALPVNHSQATSHLRTNHEVSESDRRCLTRYPTSINPNGFCNPTEAPLRDDGSDAHPQLRIHDGYACLKCSYYTVNHPELSKHISKNHLNGQQATRERTQDLCDGVYLQIWTHASSWRYWRVKKDGNMIRG